MRPGGPRISKEVVIRSALAGVQALEREHARQTQQPPATGFTVTDAYLTASTASVSDALGHVVTVSPPPTEAWAIAFAAPPQGLWASISALQEVDARSGVVVGGGLWAVPVDAPVKAR